MKTSSTKRSFWRLAHWLFFMRALWRGPRYFVGYELRRQARRAMYRATRRMGARPPQRG